MPTNLLTFSRRHWRNAGYYVEKTEHIQRRGKRTWRVDLHGFADLVAVGHWGTDPQGQAIYEYVGVQVTSWKNVPSRVRKILEGEETIGKGQWETSIRQIAYMFLSVPHHRIIVEGWRKKGGRWRRRAVEIVCVDGELEQRSLT